MKMRKRLLNDDRMNEISNPFYDFIENYIEDNIVYSYLAVWIGTKYTMNAMWEHPFDTHLHDAVNSLCDIDRFDIDMKKLNQELKNNLV